MHCSDGTSCERGKDAHSQLIRAREIIAAAASFTLAAFELEQLDWFSTAPVHVSEGRRRAEESSAIARELVEC